MESACTLGGGERRVVVGDGVIVYAVKHIHDPCMHACIFESTLRLTI